MASAADHKKPLQITQNNLPLSLASLLNNISCLYLITGICALISGYLFYVVFRNYDPLLFGITTRDIIPNAKTVLPEIFYYSIPSFIHVMSLSLIHIGLVSPNRKNTTKIILFWTFSNVIFEFLQNTWQSGFQLISGTCDTADMLFAIVGGITVMLTIHFKPEKKVSRINSSTAFSKRQQNIAFSCVVLLGIGTMLGCDMDREADPIYLSYAELRSPLKIEDERSLRYLGTPYIHESILLINERNRGLHIFDYSDTENPVFQKFINIPGNTDMEIKNGLLYANSYIDLLIIDVSDLSNIMLTKRHENFFAYNAHQNIPKNIVLLDLDISKGVVVDYKIVTKGE